MNRRQCVAALLVAAFAASVHAASADYPSKPVKIVVPYPPGGSADLIGRMVADKLSKSLGQPVIVENKGGASGAIGSEFVAHADPDGYTMLDVQTPGRFRVGVDFSPGRMISSGPRCHTEPEIE